MGPWTYLVYELVWALPIIAGQWVLAHAVFRANLRTLLLGIAIPTAYLCAADALAIRVGIWSLNPELTLNVWLGGLPLEEGVFFLVTNVMVVQGIVMLVCKPPPSPSRPHKPESRRTSASTARMTSERGAR